MIPFFFPNSNLKYNSLAQILSELSLTPYPEHAIDAQKIAVELT